MLGELNPNFICSHGILFYFSERRKMQGNKKRVVSVRGGASTGAFF
jgi:hypothetical protein